jgi:hypothetical protein
LRQGPARVLRPDGEASLVVAGLAVEDSIRRLWVVVLRSLDSGNEAAARMGLSQLLDLDRSAQPPSSAPARLGELLAEARARLPSKTPRKDERSRLENDRKAAAEWEPEPQALLRAAQALYDNLEVAGTASVIDMARSSALGAQQ